MSSRILGQVGVTSVARKLVGANCWGASPLNRRLKGNNNISHTVNFRHTSYFFKWEVRAMATAQRNKSLFNSKTIMLLLGCLVIGLLIYSTSRSLDQFLLAENKEKYLKILPTRKV